MADSSLVVKAAERKAKAVALRTLTQYPEWDLYHQELEQMEARWLERMLAGTKEDFSYAQGFIHGLRAAAHLPKAILDSLSGISP